MSGFATQAYQMSLTGRQLNPSSGGSAPEGGASESLQVYDTYAELDAQAAEDGNLGLVASGTEGEPRLFRYATDTWVPDEPVVWTIATTGDGVIAGLIDAAGPAVYPGDLGADGNGTIYAAVGNAGRCVFVPRYQEGGLDILDHNPTLQCMIYKKDPATVPGVVVGTSGSGSVDWDTTVAGRIALRGGSFAGGYAQLAVVMPASVSSATHVLQGALAYRGTNGGASVYMSAGVRGRNVTYLQYPAPSNDWRPGISGPDPVIGGEPTVEHDILFVAEVGSSKPNRFYQSNPSRAADSAIQTADNDQNVTFDVGGSTNAVLKTFWSSEIDCLGWYVVTLEVP